MSIIQMKMTTKIIFFKLFSEKYSDCIFCNEEESVKYVSRYPSNLSPFSNFIVYYCCKCGVGFVPGVLNIIEKYYFEKYAQNTMPDRYLDPHKFFNRVSDQAIKKNGGPPPNI